MIYCLWFMLFVLAPVTIILYEAINVTERAIKLDLEEGVGDNDVGDNSL